MYGLGAGRLKAILYCIVLYYLIRRYNIGLTQQLVHDKMQNVLKDLTGKH